MSNIHLAFLGESCKKKRLWKKLLANLESTSRQSLFVFLLVCISLSIFWVTLCTFYDIFFLQLQCHFSNLLFVVHSMFVCQNLFPRDVKSGELAFFNLLNQFVLYFPQSALIHTLTAFLVFQFIIHHFFRTQNQLLVNLVLCYALTH